VVHWKKGNWNQRGHQKGRQQITESQTKKNGGGQKNRIEGKLEKKGKNVDHMCTGVQQTKKKKKLWERKLRKKA